MNLPRVSLVGSLRGCLCAFALYATLAAISPSAGAAITAENYFPLGISSWGVPQRLPCGDGCGEPLQTYLEVEEESEEPRGWKPKEIRDAYRIPVMGGSDQTIAIIAQADDPSAEEDLAKYRSMFKMSPCTEKNGCFRKRDAFGTASNFPPPDAKSALESSLDLEMASVACPECKLLLVEAEKPNDLKSVGEAVDQAVALGATVVSLSLGMQEPAGASSYNKYFTHPGIPITAGAGDEGYENFLEPQSTGYPSYPASAPSVIAVGATELRQEKKTPRGWTDNVWPKTGGGCSSSQMSKPDWQDFITDCSNRMASDIAIVGKEVAVYVTYPNSQGNGIWDRVGGTSVGAPLVAGIYAHASEKVRNEPAVAIYSNLYDGFGDIFDVGPSKKHNNTNYQGHSCSPLYLCNAVAGKDGDPMSGYDGPTGVGIPQGVPALPKWVIANSRVSELGNTGLNPPDIDCVSTTMCTAVGSDPSLGDAPLAAEWDGYAWSAASVPLENKEFEWLGGLTGVSCPTSSFCLAVGQMYGSVWSKEAYVLRWNGEGWKVDESAPRLPGDFWSAPYSISCSSTTDCVIVGGESQGSPEGSPLVSAHWTSSGWSTLEVPYPSGAAEALLEDVSCVAEVENEEEVEEEEVEEGETCLAVGWQYSVTAEAFQTFVERWDGYEWSVDTSLSPPGFQSFLYDVSCPSVNSCMTVGWVAESPENYKYKDTVPLSEHWNGSEWVLGKPPLPEPKINPHGTEEEIQVLEEEKEEEEEGELYGVSCGTPTSCVTVGIDFGTGYIVGGWNGTSWSEQKLPEMPSAAFYFGDAVDCVTVSFCQAFGGGGGSVLFTALTEDPMPYLGNGGAVAYVDPNEAIVGATINPNGYATTYQFEYGTTIEYGSKAPTSPKSIGSGTSGVEVSEEIEGLKPETTYHFRLVATNEKGTVEGEDKTFTTPSWKLLSTPNPKEATDSDLYDVSCEPSTNVCTAVGKSTVSGSDRPVAQRWNGTSWSEQTAAKKSGSAQNRLFGVDCPSETRCLAVGNYQNSEGGPATLGELWNESKWSVQTTPVPSEASSSELVAVGCNSTASCRAAGSAVIKGTKTAIVEAWASPTWTLQTVPIPEGATSSQLDGIDCIWSNFCAAVGRYTTSGGSIKSLVMFWNGTEWSLHSVTDPEGATQSTLSDISCTATPNRCTAVGGWKNSKGEQFTLAYRFNGVTTWTLQSTPNPSGSAESVLQDVSCASETSCTAAGSQVAGGSTQTLAEKWNGTSWSIQGTPDPSGAAFSSLFGVSCRSTTCMGVGWSTDKSGVDTTLGEMRE